MAVLAIETMIEDIATASVAADLEAMIKEIVETEKIVTEIAGEIVGRGEQDQAGVLPGIVEVAVEA